jgi:hypothetical protein
MDQYMVQIHFHTDIRVDKVHIYYEHHIYYN